MEGVTVTALTRWGATSVVVAHGTLWDWMKMDSHAEVRLKVVCTKND